MALSGIRHLEYFKDVEDNDKKHDSDERVVLAGEVHCRIHKALDNAFATSFSKLIAILLFALRDAF